MLCGIRQGLHDNALDLAALVGERHDKLFCFDGHRARDDCRSLDFCSRGIGSDVRGIDRSAFGNLGGCILRGGTKYGRFLRFGLVHRQHQFGRRIRLGDLRRGSLLRIRLGGSGLGPGLFVRGVHRHPHDDDYRHEYGTDNGILIHLLSFRGGTGS